MFRDWDVDALSLVTSPIDDSLADLRWLLRLSIELILPLRRIVRGMARLGDLRGELDAKRCTLAMGKEFAVQVMPAAADHRVTSIIELRDRRTVVRSAKWGVFSSLRTCGAQLRLRPRLEIETARIMQVGQGEQARRLDIQIQDARTR